MSLLSLLLLQMQLYLKIWPTVYVKSISQLIRIFNIGECGRVQGICMETFLDMPTTSPSLILWCMDWDWGRTIANDPASAIAESKCAQDDTVGNQQVLLDATVEWNQ